MLYASNTFQAVFTLDVRRAQEWHQVLEALQSLHLPADFEPPDAASTQHVHKPRYTQVNITHIRRLDVKTETSFRAKPHWTQLSLPSNTKARIGLKDVCKSFIEPGALGLCIFSTGGFGDSIDWMGAAGEAPHYAKALHATMWSYHEWHLERVLLAAARQMGFLWINDYSSSNAVSLDTPCFHQDLRKLTIKQRNKVTATADVGHDLPKHFRLIGYLCRWQLSIRPQ